MNRISIVCITAATLSGCIDGTGPQPNQPDGKWCDKVGTFPHPESGGTITYQNTTILREENINGYPYVVEVRGCKATINPPQT